MLPFWIHEQIKNPVFTLETNTKGVLVALMFTLAQICATIGYDLGKGGNVQAIENLKVIWQTLLVSIIDGLVPNALEFTGLALSILGVLLIVLRR